MGRSRLGWVLGAIAPWWLGAALAVSLPADAGQEAASGASLAPLALRPPTPPSELVPAQVLGLRGGFASLPGAFRPASNESLGDALSGPLDIWSAMPRILRQASLVISDSKSLERLPDEVEPRPDLKRNAGRFPAIDRSLKGDPAVGLRPTFDARLRRPGGLANLRARDLLFEHDEAWPVSGFETSESDFAGPDGVAAFEAWPDGEAPTTAPSSGQASPGQRAGAMTMRPACVNERLIQGATPPVRRAEALSSTTPAPADSTPVEVEALAPAPQTAVPEASVAPQAPAWPGYAAAMGRKGAKEMRCLADAIYFEARGEPEEGQAAVAQVVLNRVSSGLYPSTICGVVYQNRQRHNACQFSFACEGRALRVNEPEAWRAAVRVAAEVAAGATYVSDVGGATLYHANYVRPRWARSLDKIDVIGHHNLLQAEAGPDLMAALGRGTNFRLLSPTLAFTGRCAVKSGLRSSSRAILSFCVRLARKRTANRLQRADAPWL